MIKNETKTIERVALFAFLLNLTLAILKGALAVFSDSIAITAGVIDSITDSIGSLTVYVGIRLSSRKTARFPLGLYKLENVLSVVISLFIFISGYEIGRTVFLQSPESRPDISLLTLVLLSLSSLAIFAFGRYALVRGRRTGSPVLIAEGKHRQSDVLVSAVILLSSLLTFLGADISIGWWSPDRIAALIVIGFVIHTGWNLLSDGMRVLLDASLDRDTYEQIQTLISADPDVREIKELVGRTAGRFLFVQCTITTSETNLNKAHAVSDRVEGAIKELIPRVERVAIHVEPMKKSVEIIAIAVEEDARTLSSGFTHARSFALYPFHVDTSAMGKAESFMNPIDEQGKGRGLRIAEWLIDHGVDTVILPQPIQQKGFFYALDSAGVHMHITERRTVDEALAEFSNQREA